MSKALMEAQLSADDIARDRIRRDLDTNFLVEAGAGSGKTTALLQRLVSHVLAGHPVESLAAVTFTRKAAAELAEGFREKLESERRTPESEHTAEENALLDTALEHIDRSFVGTIHAFCGRLLRERPLEAELDPAFVEVSGSEWVLLCEEYWRSWVHQRVIADDADIAALHAIGVEPYTLGDAFKTIVGYQDVTFPAGDAPLPDTRNCRRHLRSLMKRASALRPASEPDSGWDELQNLLSRLNYLERTTDWEGSVADFCEAVACITTGKCKVTQNRWSNETAGKKVAKDLGLDFASSIESHFAPLLQSWYEHRYGPVMKVLLRARDDFERHRISTGNLGFGDLLARAAGMLVRDASARTELGERFRYLMVDEFQDTDPLQAEVCFLLASEPSDGNDWRTVKPRPGALFVVGDPKQSIYRFRRADIEIYDLVKRRMEEVGSVVRLTRNFRSVPEIGEFVNSHFSCVFPAEADAVQATYAPIIAQAPPAGGPAVFAYKVSEGSSKGKIYADDAERIASRIANRLTEEEGRRPADFLVLTWKKESILTIAKALAARNVPAVSTGANIEMEVELEELLAVLHALADPANPVRVAAVLQGLFIGASPADLYEAHLAGVKLSLLEEPQRGTGIVADAIIMLRRWRALSLRTSVDSLVDTILDETGLLAWTAGGELGESKSGILLRIVALLRAEGVEASGSLSDAIERIHSWLETDPEEATLRPGRGDAVRVMNVHQAKGLEAEIVVLASPYKPTKVHGVDLHVERGGRGEAIGMMQITRPGPQENTDIVVAQPPDWAAAAEREQEYQNAERERQRYVAATRAKRELWIAQLDSDKSAGMWDCFTQSLAGLPIVDLPIGMAPGRVLLEESAESIGKRIANADAARAAASVPSYELRTVSRSAKATVIDRADPGSIEEGGRASRGKAWGRAVHRVVEGMGRGRSGEGLRRFAEAVVADEFGQDTEDDSVDQILGMAAGLAESAHWRKLMGCEERHFELSVASVAEENGVSVLTEGVIDAVGFDGERWHVFDWKSDRCSEADWEGRVPQYQLQVDGYARILSERYGQPATGTIVRLQRDSGVVTEGRDL